MESQELSCIMYAFGALFYKMTLPIMLLYLLYN